MSRLLRMLLGNSKTLDEALAAGARDAREASTRSNIRSFHVTTEGPLTTTELYPVSKNNNAYQHNND